MTLRAFSFVASFLCVLGLSLTACGRPAREEECNEIVTRIVELELKSLGMADQTAEEAKRTREALAESTRRDCVGRRLDDDAMRCVRAAKSAQEITTQCF